MEFDIENVDVDRLRDDLRDEYGTAAFSCFPVAMKNLFDVESATDYEIVMQAIHLGYNIDKYMKDHYVKKY